MLACLATSGEVFAGNLERKPLTCMRTAFAVSESGRGSERQRRAVQAYRAAAEAGDPLGDVLEKELLREVTALVDASGALRQQALSQAMTQARPALAPALNFGSLEEPEKPLRRWTPAARCVSRLSRRPRRRRAPRSHQP